MKFKSAVILRNEHNESTFGASKVLEKKLKEFGLTILSLDSIENGTVVFTLGGDGTVLRSAKLLTEKDIFVMGINFGHLGFLSPYEFKEIDLILKKILIDDKFSIVERRFAEAKDEFWKVYFFNEFVVQRDVPSHVIDVEVRIDESLIGRITCDGVIVSTSTGSTAYNLSAGGPIIDPMAGVISIVPMMAHTFFKAPIIVSSKRKIGLKVIPREKEKYFMVSDGNVLMNYNEPQEIKISDSEKFLKFLCTDDRDFFKIVHQKLSWGVRNGVEHDDGF
jgi:NAD+ kinase|uniref:NAD kinase n=1 Tax=Mesoaciditoga lauensis TaxID=1495039 RepID=A0A7V3VSG3_9BACT